MKKRLRKKLFKKKYLLKLDLGNGKDKNSLIGFIVMNESVNIKNFSKLWISLLKKEQNKLLF